jgi:hypothetical protein
MVCPCCRSNLVRRLPANSISPQPAYKCDDCGRRLRARGTFFIYMVIALIGLTFPALLVWMALEGDEDRVLQMAYLGAVGVVVAIYSIVQLLRPAPLPDPPPGEAIKNAPGPTDW